MSKIDKTDIENIKLITKEAKLTNISKIKIKKVNNILEELGLEDIPQIIVNNKIDMISDSKLKTLMKRKTKDIFLSAENESQFDNLHFLINETLFNGMYQGWISLESNLGNIRSMLFDMGCVKEEKVSDDGKMFANIKIGNDELDQFIGMKGFQLCSDKDIILTN